MKQFPRVFVWIVGVLHLAALIHGCSRPRPEPDPVWEAKRDREIVEWYHSHWKECPKATVWEIHHRGADKTFRSVIQPEIREGRIAFAMAGDDLIYNLDADDCDIREIRVRIWKGEPVTWREFICEDNAMPELQQEPSP